MIQVAGLKCSSGPASGDVVDVLILLVGCFILFYSFILALSIISLLLSFLDACLDRRDQTCRDSGSAVNEEQML